MAGVVAVTGATGFIGTHVVRRLAAGGRPVRILTRRVPGSALLPLPPVEAVIGDLTDMSALRRLIEGADALVHVAGAVKAPSTAAFHAANAAGTRAVAAECSRLPGFRFIHMSSLAAREPSLSDYARSKHEAELEVSRLTDLLNWTILRPPVVYGPGDREVLAVFRAARSGFVVAPGGRDHRLSFLHVEDLADMVDRLVDSAPATGQTIEIDDGKPGGYGWPEIADHLSAALARRLRVLPVAPPVVRLAARANAAAHSLLGGTAMFTPGKAREFLHRDWAARPNRRLDPVLRRSFINIRQGFESTVRWYRAAGWL